MALHCTSKEGHALVCKAFQAITLSASSKDSRLLRSDRSFLFRTFGCATAIVELERCLLEHGVASPSDSYRFCVVAFDGDDTDVVKAVEVFDSWPLPVDKDWHSGLAFKRLLPTKDTPHYRIKFRDSVAIIREEVRERQAPFASQKYRGLAAFLGFKVLLQGNTWVWLVHGQLLNVLNKTLGLGQEDIVERLVTRGVFGHTITQILSVFREDLGLTCTPLPGTTLVQYTGLKKPTLDILRTLLALVE
jgi:hypothetical protein